MAVTYSRLDLLKTSCIASPPEKDQSRLTGRAESAHNPYSCIPQIFHWLEGKREIEEGVMKMGRNKTKTPK